METAVPRQNSENWDFLPSFVVGVRHLFASGSPREENLHDTPFRSRYKVLCGVYILQVLLVAQASCVWHTTSSSYTEVAVQGGSGVQFLAARANLVPFWGRQKG